MHIKQSLMTLVAAAIGIIGLSACSTIFAGGSGDLVSPQGYVTNAASSDQFEIQSSKLALQRSQNPEVRSFAQQMIDDHMMTTAGLKEMIQAHNIPVAIPAEQGILLPQHRLMLTALEQSNDFDHDYINAQVKSHSEAAMVHQTYTDNGGNVWLVQNAANALPHIVMHRDMAIQMSNAMKQGHWYTELYPWNYGWSR